VRCFRIAVTKQILVQARLAVHYAAASFMCVRAHVRVCARAYTRIHARARTCTRTHMCARRRALPLLTALRPRSSVPHATPVLLHGLPLGFGFVGGSWSVPLRQERRPCTFVAPFEESSAAELGARCHWDSSAIVTDSDAKAEANAHTESEPVDAVVSESESLHTIQRSDVMHAVVVDAANTVSGQRNERGGVLKHYDFRVRMHTLERNAQGANLNKPPALAPTRALKHVPVMHNRQCT
jgi:hypothetical protein